MTMPQNETPRSGQSQAEIQSVHDRTMTNLVSRALIDVIDIYGDGTSNYNEAEQAARNFVRSLVGAVEVSVADRIRERAEELRGSNDGSSRDAATMFYDLADAIAPQSTERHLVQE